jgi:hypothetical protein
VSLDAEQIADLRASIARGEALTSIARRLGISVPFVSDVKHGRRFVGVTRVELVAMLRRLEWKGVDAGLSAMCLECDGHPGDVREGGGEHEPTCELGQLLARLDAEDAAG